jgi:hypothetical protein
MTTTLAHPEAEDLGRFIEGTLDEPQRAAVVEHVADCDDCRIIVVDASEFFAKEHPVRQPNVSGRWWAAAAAIAIAVGGVWLVDARRDPLAPVIEASSQLKSRLVAARLSGFGYVAPKNTMRGTDGSTDLAAYQVAAKADEVLQRRGDNSRMQHAKGVAQLLDYEAQLAELDADTTDEQRQKLVDQRNAAIPMLQSAARSAPRNAAYLSDLAAAFIAKGDFQQAVDVCNRALQIDSRSPDARFNLAKAKDLLAVTPAEQTEAIKAYNAYLEVDHTSPWANEARDRVTYLKDLSLP